MKCEAIYVWNPEYSVRKMCKALGVYENQYYRWLKGEERRKKRRELEQSLVDQVALSFKESGNTYGCRKLCRALGEKQIVISEWKVRKIMRENGLYSISSKRYRPSQGKRKKGERYSENLIKRKFSPEGFSKVWAGDITYIPTNIGWVYLAVVMDLYNREIIGYHVSKEINTELVCRALRNAKSKYPKAKEVIFHSDRGCQYSSTRFQSSLSEAGFKSSMSAPGCPYDNSCVESFFAGMKKECIRRKEYATIEDVKRDLFQYIELFYNRKRLHSTLGYMSPVSYRLLHDGAKMM